MGAQTRTQNRKMVLRHGGARLVTQLVAESGVGEMVEDEEDENFILLISCAFGARSSWPRAGLADY